MTSTTATKDNHNDHSYDAFAKEYAQYSSVMTMPHSSDLIRLAEAQIRQAKRILELGCGSGEFGLAYQQHFPHGIAGQAIVCTDQSQAMVALAQERIQNAAAAAAVATDTTGTVTNTTTTMATEFNFYVADAARLQDWDDESFDMIVSAFGIFIVPEQECMLQEVNRVLKTSGTLATTSWTSTGHDDSLTMAGFGFVYTKAWGAIQLAQPPKSPPPSLLAAMEWFDPEKIRSLLQSNDLFHQVTIRRSIHTTMFANVEHLWLAMTTSNPYGAAYANEEPELVAKNKAQLGAFVTASHNDDDSGEADSALFTLLASNLVLATKGKDATETKRARHS